MTQSEQLLKDAGAALAQLRSALDGADTQPPEPQAAAALTPSSNPCRTAHLTGNYDE